MITRYRSRRSTLGLTMVEALMAGFILSIGVMGVCKLWQLSYNVTANTDDVGVAYNLARLNMESAKMSGFPNVAAGTKYYDGAMNPVAAGAARWMVVTTVTVDPAGAGLNADTKLKQIDVSAILKSTNTTLYRTSTYLADKGI